MLKPKSFYRLIVHKFFCSLEGDATATVDRVMASQGNVSSRFPIRKSN